MVNETTGSVLTLDDDLSERDLLFNAYLEGDLPDDERAQFDRRLADDAEFAKEYQDFQSVVGGLGDLPFEFAPPDFVERVQRQIRTRSRGRFFAEQFLFKARVPYEVVGIVMIVIMAAAYLFMGAPPDKQMRDVTIPEPPPRLKTDGSDTTP